MGPCLIRTNILKDSETNGHLYQILSAAKMMTSQFPSREYSLLSGLKPYLGKAVNESYEVTVGDDAAVRRCSSEERLVVTADTSVEGIHFSLEEMTMAEAAYRAMVSNVSDCASMGATPDSALIQLVFPVKCEKVEYCIEEFYKGFSEACDEWKFPIVGGDLSGGPVWMIAITLIGKTEKGRRVILRKGIRPGDVLWCTGFPGKSAAGFDALAKWGRKNVPQDFLPLIRNHVRPSARVNAGLLLANDLQIHAMMDLSDGLSKDVNTLCYDNGVGCILDPISSQIPAVMVQLGKKLSFNAEQWILHGGEDYELIFAAAPEWTPDVYKNEPHDSDFVKLGVFVKGSNFLQIQDKNGNFKRIEQKSWDHLLNKVK